jgi:hypothetical protein
MYHHGFAMLALAEAYGAVDDRDLWADASSSNYRSIGQALELAVRAAITSQKKNPLGAWRYSPDSNDADTSVSGAVLVGLLAARNAGIEVPDASIDKAPATSSRRTPAIISNTRVTIRHKPCFKATSTLGENGTSFSSVS